MKFIKKHKKGLIIWAIVIAAIVGIVIWFKNTTKKAMDILSSAMAETAVAEKRDLVSVVSATGKITSVKNKDLSSIATGTKIKEVLVEVGDEVKEGQILVVLDSEDIEKKLSDAKNSLATSKKSSNLSINSAQRMYNEQVVSNDATISNVNDKIKDIEKQITDQKNIKGQSEDLYDSAKEQREAIQKQIDALTAPITAAKSLVETKKAELEKAKADLMSVSDNDALSPDDLAKAQAVVDVKTDELDAANQALAIANENAFNLVSLQGQLDALKSAESMQLANYNASVSAIDQLESSLDTTKDSLDDTVRQTTSALATREDSLNSAKLQASTGTSSMELQISALEDQLEACSVTAPFDGMITSLNAEAGDMYSGMVIASVEDVSAYEITTEIDEYDIGKIKKGQRVVIKTNGTGDEELKGTVKSVAPRATMGQSVTYTVVISVDTKNDMLKLDMTAKLSIVLEESNNTLTVPYEAVLTDDEGNEYVQVVDGKDANGLLQTHDVYVTTGIKSDYYVEILDGLKGGEEVKVEREASSIFDFSALMEDSGAMGGM